MRRRCNEHGTGGGDGHHAATRVRRRENEGASRLRRSRRTVLETERKQRFPTTSTTATVAPLWTATTGTNSTTDTLSDTVTNGHRSRGRKFSALLLVAAAAGCCCLGLCPAPPPTLVGASEFPERECCDPVYPPLPDPESMPPGGQVLPTTTISSSASGGLGAAGIGGGGGGGGLGVLPGGIEGPEGIVVGIPGGIGHVGVSKNTIGYSGE